MISQDEPTTDIKPATSKTVHDAASKKMPAHRSAELAPYSIYALDEERLITILIR